MSIILDGYDTDTFIITKTDIINSEKLKIVIINKSNEIQNIELNFKDIKSIGFNLIKRNSNDKEENK